MQRISWRSHGTGATGHGQWVSYDLSKEVERLNAEHVDTIHWVERKENPRHSPPPLPQGKRDLKQQAEPEGTPEEGCKFRACSSKQAERA